MTLFDQYYLKLSEFLDTRIELDPNWIAAQKLRGKLCACRREQDLIYLKEQILICLGTISEVDPKTIKLVLEFSTMLYSISIYECFYNLIEVYLKPYVNHQNIDYSNQAKNILKIMGGMSKNSGIQDLKTLLQNELNSGYFVSESPFLEGLKYILNDLPSLHVESSFYLLAEQVLKLLSYSTVDVSVLILIQKSKRPFQYEQEIAEFVKNINEYIETVKNEWLGGWGKQAQSLVQHLESRFWNQDIFLLRYFLIDFKDKNLTGYFSKSNRLGQIVENMIERLPSRRLLYASIGPIPLEIQQDILSNSDVGYFGQLSRGYYDIRQIPGYREFIEMEGSQEKPKEIRDARMFNNLPF